MRSTKGNLRDGEGTRASILRVVTENPGVHKSELCRVVGMGWGTVSYHLRLLEKARLLQTHLGARETRVFPGSVSDGQLRSLAAIKSGQGERIARALAENPGARQGDLCSALGVSRKLIRRHLGLLLKEGLVTSQGDRRARYEATAELETLVAPSLGAEAPLSNLPVSP